MADAYTIGVKLALSGNMSAMLTTIAGQLGDLDKQVTTLMEKWNKLSGNGKAVIGGAAALGIGVGTLDVLGKIADHGKDLLDQQDKLRRAGVEGNKVLQITSDYYDKIASKIPTASADQYLKSFNELRTVFGGDEALSKTPYALKLDAMIANATGTDSEGAGFNIYRALEMRGTTLTDEAGTDQLADAMAQVIIGSGGKITAATYSQMAKRAGSSWMQFDPAFITGGLSVAAGDMGGDTAGTAAMSLQQFLTGAHTLSKQQLGVLKDAGLIDMSKVTTDKGGRVNMGPGAITGSEQGAHDQYGWVKDIVAPALMKLAGGDQEKFDSYIAKLGSNRNVTRMMAMFSDPGIQAQIEKDIQLWKQSKGIDAAYGAGMQDNPKMVDQAYEAQKKSMLEAIGAPVMQAAIPVMKGITDAFTGIGAWANANRGTAKVIAEIVGALAGLTALGGSAAMIKGGIGMLTGQGGLMGSATALNASAAALNSAAVALGGRPAGIAPSAAGNKRLGLLAGAGIAAAALFAADQWNNIGKGWGEGSFWHNLGWGPTKPGEQDWLTGATHRYVPGMQALDNAVGLTNDRTDYSAGMHPNTRRGLGTNPNYAANLQGTPSPPVNTQIPPPPPPINVQVTPPPPASMTGTVTLNGSIIGQFTAALSKSLGGFSTGAPAANSGTMMPAVDGGGGHGGY